MLSVASAMNDPGVQDGWQWQTPKRKLRSTSRPLGVCTTSGWNWMPKMPLPSVNAATGELPLLASIWKPGGISLTWSPWLIQTGSSPCRPPKSAFGSRTERSAGPYSRAWPGSTLPPRWWAMSCIP
jgi:hypothetical protein